MLAQGAPYFAAPALQAALRTYQDYLLRHITVRAGALKRPIIMHSAVALHPALRLDWNSPLNLDKVFLDEEVQKAGTQFVLIHAGYPSHHAVAAMLSQFPNLFADVSFYSKFPGVLEEIYRVFLSLAPPTKVMHGSDSNNVPEEIGYCAWNTRQVLAKVLRDFRGYGWTEADCARVATSVLSENATPRVRPAHLMRPATRPPGEMVMSWKNVARLLVVLACAAPTAAQAQYDLKQRPDMNTTLGPRRVPIPPRDLSKEPGDRAAGRHAHRWHGRAPGAERHRRHAGQPSFSRSGRPRGHRCRPARPRHRRHRSRTSCPG